MSKSPTNQDTPNFKETTLRCETLKDFVSLTNEVTVPINLIFLSLKDKKVKPTILRTFLYLKLHYPDRFIKTKAFLDECSKRMGITIKTLVKHIQKLIKLNWLGYNDTNNRLFLRSIKRIISPDRSMIYMVRIMDAHLKHFNEFLIAVTVAYLRKKFKQNKPELDNGGSLQGLVRSEKILPGFAPLAVKYISYYMSRSTSWVDKYKQRAIKISLIERKSDRLETIIPWKSRNLFLEAHPLYRGRLIKRGGSVSIVAIDLLRSNVLLLKRKSNSRSCK